MKTLELEISKNMWIITAGLDRWRTVEKISTSTWSLTDKVHSSVLRYKEARVDEARAFLILEIRIANIESNTETAISKYESLIPKGIPRPNFEIWYSTLKITFGIRNSRFEIVPSSPFDITFEIRNSTFEFQKLSKELIKCGSSSSDFNQL